MSESYYGDRFGREELRRLAQQAMDAANRANSRLDTHDALWEERWETMEERFGEIIKGVSGLWKIIISTGLGAASLLVILVLHQVFGIGAR